MTTPATRRCATPASGGRPCGAAIDVARPSTAPSTRSARACLPTTPARRPGGSGVATCAGNVPTARRSTLGTGRRASRSVRPTRRQPRSRRSSTRSDDRAPTTSAGSSGRSPRPRRSTAGWRASGADPLLAGRRRAATCSRRATRRWPRWSAAPGEPDSGGRRAARAGVTGCGTAAPGALRLLVEDRAQLGGRLPPVRAEARGRLASSAPSSASRSAGASSGSTPTTTTDCTRAAKQLGSGAPMRHWLVLAGSTRSWRPLRAAQLAARAGRAARRRRRARGRARRPRPSRHRARRREPAPAAGPPRARPRRCGARARPAPPAPAPAAGPEPAAAAEPECRRRSRKKRQAAWPWRPPRRAVTIKRLRLRPGAVTVDVGDTVTWTNDGPDAALRHRQRRQLRHRHPRGGRERLAHVRRGRHLRLHLHAAPVHEGHRGRAGGGSSSGGHGTTATARLERRRGSTTTGADRRPASTSERLGAAGDRSRRRCAARRRRTGSRARSRRLRDQPAAGRG